jgi:hypothetical protein
MSYADLIGPFAMVISNGVKKNGSDVFNILDLDDGGAKTFSVPLNASGLAADPVTHWAAYTFLEPQTHYALTQMTTTELKTYVDEMAALKGRTPVGSITAFPSSLSISEQGADFWAFIDSLGLKLINQDVL